MIPAAVTSASTGPSSASARTATWPSAAASETSQTWASARPPPSWIAAATRSAPERSRRPGWRQRSRRRPTAERKPLRCRCRLPSPPRPARRWSTHRPPSCSDLLPETSFILEVAGEELAQALGAGVAEDGLGRALLLDPAVVEKHRRGRNLAREAEERIIAITSPFSALSETPLSTSSRPKLLCRSLNTEGRHGPGARQFTISARTLSATFANSLASTRSPYWPP
jgi:hypothetical protein